MGEKYNLLCASVFVQDVYQRKILPRIDQILEEYTILAFRIPKPGDLVIGPDGRIIECPERAQWVCPRLIVKPKVQYRFVVDGLTQEEADRLNLSAKEGLLFFPKIGATYVEESK